MLNAHSILKPGSKNTPICDFKASQIIRKYIFWAELESIIKTIFYTQKEQFLWGYYSCTSKHPFTVQSQILVIYELRQRTASPAKLHKGTSHPGSLQFTRCLVAQTRCSAHHGLAKTVSPWEGACVRAKHRALAPWALDHQPPAPPIWRCSFI